MQAVFDFLFASYATYTWQDIALEATAVLFGLLSVWYAGRERILVYPTGLVSTGIYVYICFVAGLYGDMGINAYYCAMSLYGWYRWTQPAGDAPVLPICWHRGRERWISLGLLLGFFVLLAWVLDRFTDSTVPRIDAFTTAVFFVAMWEMARKKVESWIYWIVGDVVSVPLYYYKGLTLTSIQYLVFLWLAVLGLLAWHKKATARPVLSTSTS
ncbi:MAG: nicotinamide riboside transporter PnuC [Bacteroidia bacterium]